jgi:hypothetical protein
MEKSMVRVREHCTTMETLGGVIAPRSQCRVSLRKKRPEEDANFGLIKDCYFFPPFLSNEPGTGFPLLPVIVKNKLKTGFLYI